MKIKFWILVVIIYKVTGNVSCKFKSYRGSQKSTLILIQSQRIFYAKIGGKRAILTPFYEK